LTVEDGATNNTLRRALFKPNTTDLKAQGTRATLTFEYQDAAGLPPTRR
jgi:hypothetical protein